MADLGTVGENGGVPGYYSLLPRLLQYEVLLIPVGTDMDMHPLKSTRVY